MLKPIDSAIFLTSFTRAQTFDDIELMVNLEISFLSRIEEANITDIVTFLSAFTYWRGKLLDEIFKTEGAPMSHKKKFRIETEAIYELCLHELFKRGIDQIDEESICLVIDGAIKISLSRRKPVKTFNEFVMDALVVFKRKRYRISD